MAQHQERFIVRFPGSMREQLKVAAQLNRRSMNAEIIFRLERSLATARPAPEAHSHTDVTAQRAIEGEPEPDTETMQSYSAHDAEFPAPASLARVTANAEA